jgi:hypothetical protein
VLVDVAAQRNEFIGLRVQDLQFVVQKSVCWGIHGRTFSITGLAD